MSLSDELFEKQIRLMKLIDDIKDEDFTLDAERAALYLGLSPSTLAHSRLLKYRPANADGGMERSRFS